MIDYREDYYRGIAKLYFNLILKTVIRMGSLRQEKGVILDFGCGHQYLKHLLPNKNIIGFDIIPELSDVSDYRNLSPSVIVCNNVLEHLTPHELKQTLQAFHLLKPKQIITAVPTENLLSRLGMILTGMLHSHDDHKSSLVEIRETLKQYFFERERKRIFTLNELSVWVPRHPHD